MNRRMQRWRWILGVLALAILFGLRVIACSGNSGSQTASPPPQAQTFTTFDALGAGTGKNQGSVATGINATPTVAGIEWDASGVAHGFVRTAAGATTTFDAPGAGTGKDEGTFPFSIDSAGNIAGTYFAAGLVAHGFVRTAAGAITTFDVPGAQCPGTVPISINSGVIVGMYWDTSCVYHGFIRAANGTITTFSAPSAGTGGNLGTAAIGINSAQVVTGTYSDASNGFHGFVRAANGTITTFDAPGAGTGKGIFTTGTRFWELAVLVSTRVGMSREPTLTRTVWLMASYALPAAP
jgi:predicted membrane protein